MPYKDREANKEKIRQSNREAYRRWFARLKEDPDRYEAFKKKERRRNALRQQQDEDYAERRRQQMRNRYANNPVVRERAKERRERPEQRQRARALKCLNKGLGAHLPDQLRIVKERLERLLKQKDEI